MGRHGSTRALLVAGLLTGCAVPAASAAVVLSDDYESGVQYTGVVGSAQIRPANNNINDGAANGSFDGFFGVSPNDFLVLGDLAGVIGSDPTSGVSSVLYDLDPRLPGGGGLLTIRFDYVFDTNNANAPGDLFEVFVGSAGTGSCLAQSSPVQNSAGNRGTATCTVAVQGDNDLVIRLTESAATPARNSAVGIDNLSVSAVPEPATFALLGAGLAVLGAARRRRVAKPAS